jgi:hypothetical protein
VPSKQKLTISLAVAFAVVAAPVVVAADTPLLVPPPKHVTWSSDEPLGLEAGTVAIVLGDHAAAPERYAAELLQQHVAKRFEQQWPIVTEHDASRYAVAILLGQPHTSAWARRLCEKLQIDPARDLPMQDGYVIRTVADGDRRVVLVVGNDDRGVIYGQDTLFQMIERHPRGIVLRTADIRDWPSIRWRGRPHTHYTNYDRPGELERYAAARINFIDLRTSTYAIHAGEKLNLPAMKSLVADAHRRGLFVFATVNCGTPASEYDAILATFRQLIDLGADGLWLSFDDKGSGAMPEIIVSRVLELARKHGITPDRIAICPPKGSYQMVETDFNRRIMAVPGMERALWFWSFPPNAVDHAKARAIGLRHGMAWWHNWTRPSSGFTHAGSASLYNNGRHSYLPVPSLAAGWHAPTYEMLRDAAEYGDAIMPWGGSSWGQWYIAPIIGWWGWDPANHDFTATRTRIYRTVFGPDQVHAAMQFDDRLEEAKSLFRFSAEPTEWQPFCPPRLRNRADRDRALALLDQLATLHKQIAENAPKQTMIPAEQLETVYLDAMRGEVETGRTCATLPYPEYGWDAHQRAILDAIHRGDDAAADRLANNVRDHLQHDVATIGESLAYLRNTQHYTTWWNRIADLDAAGWRQLLADRRAQFGPRVFDYLFYVASLKSLTAGTDDPPLGWGTGRWEKTNRIVTTILPEWHEQFWGDWFAGLYEVRDERYAAFVYRRKTFSTDGQYAELPLHVPTGTGHGRLALLLFLANQDKQTIGGHYVKSRWAGRRFIELWHEDQLLWDADLGIAREPGKWFMIHLPDAPPGAASLPLRLRVLDRKDLFDHTIVLIPPIYVLEIPD